ncbi:hypothetical protein CcCBS67573_g06840 [Chytriomyces confervae]|uniref:Inositol-1-monophosphatase n=1 Tax=Chytriomyces confervae TaxID=246404 RepID=A0A507F1N3_9FUNG|nr:hypothetical protein CcCBS67573_g06840 [Chytriomyces confervae]
MESLLASALEAARLAAPVIKAAFTNRSLQGILDLKSNTSDLVTATDKAVEQLLFAHLRQLHPTHSFIGEETYDNAQLTNNYTWVIDPVDGTTNFVHGFPYTCVSVALVFEKRAVVGVVLNPILNETFYAAKGMGAWMIDSDGVKYALPLHGLKPWAGFARSLISTEYGYERDERLDSKLKSLTSVLKAPSRGVRSLGSAALEACYTARGTFDLYWEAGVHMWDVAAAAVIVEEAGGVMANFDPVVPEGCNEEFLDLAQRKFIVVRPMEGGKTEAWAVVNELRSHLETLEYARD